MMKTWMFFGLMAATAVTYAQERNTTETKPKRITVVKAGEPIKKAESPEEKLTPAQEIERCKAHLVALDKKEAYLREDVVRWKEAQGEGWLEDTNKTRTRLKKRIEELTTKLG